MQMVLTYNIYLQVILHKIILVEYLVLKKDKQKNNMLVKIKYNHLNNFKIKRLNMIIIKMIMNKM